jgi:hypothetical protein
MRSFFAPLFAASVLAFAITGCGAPADEAGDTSATAEELTSFGQSIVGTFDRVDGSGAPNQLNLAANATYTSTNVIKCITTPCLPVVSHGTWSTSGSGSSTKLRLAPSNAAAVSYYASVSSAGVLKLTTTVGSAVVSHFARPAICGGIAAIKCADSTQTCVINQTGVSDAAGVCRTRGDIGTFCGGIGGLKCWTGLTCTITETGHTDLGGTCTL